MKISSTFAILAVSVSLPCAQAAVVLQDTYAIPGMGGAATDLGGGTFGYEYDLSGSFSAAGTDKLVMVYSGHDGNDGSVTPTVANITYNGVALIEAVQEVDNISLLATGIFYLDNVITDGVLRIELTQAGTINHTFGLYAVDGLKTGVQDTGSGRLASELTTTLPVTISTSEGFFVQEAARNNQSLGDSVDDYTTLYNLTTAPDQGLRALSQYQLTSSTGDYSAPIGNTGENFRMVVAAGFEAVPEPSVALLGAMGSVLLLRRKR